MAQIQSRNQRKTNGIVWIVIMGPLLLQGPQFSQLKSGNLWLTGRLNVNMLVDRGNIKKRGPILSVLQNSHA